jgi:hypothetical protein
MFPSSTSVLRPSAVGATTIAASSLLATNLFGFSQPGVVLYLADADSAFFPAVQVYNPPGVVLYLAGSGVTGVSVNMTGVVDRGQILPQGPRSKPHCTRRGAAHAMLHSARRRSSTKNWGYVHVSLSQCAARTQHVSVRVSTPLGAQP